MLVSGRGAEIGIATAVVLATVPAAGDGPAAALPWGDATVLRRLLGQLEALAIHRAHVVTRAGWEHALAPSLVGLSLPVRVHVSPTVSDDLRTVAEIAGVGGGTVVVVHGEIVTHREALAGLLVGPRIVTGILSRHGGFPPHIAPRTRATRGRVMSAASPYHVAGRPNACLLGVLKVGERDRPALVEVAERLASLIEPPLPPGWQEELERKASRWRQSLADNGARALEVGDRQEAGRTPREPGEPEQAPRADETEAPAAGVVLSAAGESQVSERVSILREDVVSLLLVGMVRANVHVASSFLRALFWARPLSRAAVHDTADQIKGYDEDRVLLDSAVKANDGFFTTFFVSPYSRYIARWAAHRGLTPNQVTTISMAIGVLAAAAFATGSRPGLIAGAVLLQAAFTADCVDGQLARYTRTFSKVGAWLDSIFDRAKEYVVFAGLAIGASRGFGDDVWVLAVAAMTLQSVRHIADFSFGASEYQAIAAEQRPPLEVPGEVGLATVTVPTGPAPSPLLVEPAAGVPAAGVPTEPAPPLARRIVAGVARRAIALSRALERRSPTRWLKKILVFPIGERFAVISVAAAVATPRTTFVLVLVWGAVATLYTLAGRSIRSLSR